MYRVMWKYSLTKAYMMVGNDLVVPVVSMAVVVVSVLELLRISNEKKEINN